MDSKQIAIIIYNIFADLVDKGEIILSNKNRKYTTFKGHRTKLSESLLLVRLKDTNIDAFKFYTANYIKKNDIFAKHIYEAFPEVFTMHPDNDVNERIIRGMTGNRLLDSLGLVHIYTQAEKEN